MQLKHMLMFAALSMSLFSLIFFTYFELRLKNDPSSKDGFKNGINIIQMQLDTIKENAAPFVGDAVKYLDPLQLALSQLHGEVEGEYSKDDYDDDPIPVQVGSGDAPPKGSLFEEVRHYLRLDKNSAPEDDVEEGGGEEKDKEDKDWVVVNKGDIDTKDPLELPTDISKEISEKEKDITASDHKLFPLLHQNPGDKAVTAVEPDDESKDAKDGEDKDVPKDPAPKHRKKPLHQPTGTLMCNGKPSNSEVIYWKHNIEDLEYESPITPHHGIHHDRYLSFEYDAGGWNNIRMGMEVYVVCAHAMGRTLIIPPHQNLYLLGAKHPDKDGGKKAHSEMEFEDFFNLTVLGEHKGFHMLKMKEFLTREGLTGGLHGTYPPDNRTDIIGPRLWNYIQKVADYTPSWTGQFIALPHRPDAYDLMTDSAKLATHPHISQRLKAFGGGRKAVYYDDKLQAAHHIHYSSDRDHRVLQHHYAFTFFASPSMQSYYKRFIRDYMRYNDEIQCHGSSLVEAIRKDSIKEGGDGSYYALHIRRGDLQYKEVKISAQEILKNLHFKDGTPVIPAGSIVYLSTDDPEGICRGCYTKGQPCTSYSKPKPVGCQDDPSWDAFRDAGWKLRFLHHYLKPPGKALPDTTKINAPGLENVHPNQYGMIESIACSRSARFAGTLHSTFTGYIHRLRGYHGLGEETYYHSNNALLKARHEKSIGHGFSREWRYGWTDDGGEGI